MHQWLADAGDDLPATWLASEAERIDEEVYPLIVKPRRGRGSRGVQRVDDKSSLHDHLARTERNPEDLLVQAYLDGPEFTTSVVGTRDGRLLGVVPKEAIEKDGSTVLGVTRRAPAVADSCRSIFDTLDPKGPVNVQQVLDAEGIPKTIEVNPRFSSTSCLTVAADVNEFDLLVRDALHETVAPVDRYVADRYMIRYDDHIFADDLNLGK
ncbi:ATP-grasp domain-containing protein [Natronoarchaeum sp. GCM10025703]